MTGRLDITINGRFLTQQITGVQRYALEVLKGLDAIACGRGDLNIRLVTPRLASEPPRLQAIRHQTVGLLQGHAWEQIELPRYTNGDVVFCPGNTAPMALLLGSSRTVVTVHDLSHLYFPEAYSWSFRLLYGLLIPQILRRADAVITVSEAEKTMIGSHYPDALERLVAIQNGGIPSDAPLVAPVPSENPFVLYVGSLSKRKNLDGMLQVAKIVASRRHLRFVFIGGVSSALVESTVDLPAAVRHLFVFKGQVNDWEELQRYYRHATCLFFPSLYESSGLPPLEAMACGCPVLASTVPALVERCGGAALYCNPASVDDMVSKLELLLDSEPLRDELRTAGYARARALDWKRCAQMTLEVLENRIRDSS